MKFSRQRSTGGRSRHLLGTSTAARATRIIIVLLGAYIILFNIGSWILLKRVVKGQEREIESSLRSLSTILTEPPRDTFYLLEVLYDSQDGGLDREQAENFSEFVAVSELATLLGSLSSSERLESAQFLFPDGRIFLERDGSFPLPEEEDRFLQRDPQAIEQSAAGQAASTRLTPADAAMRFYQPIRDVSGNVIGILRLEANPVNFQRIRQTRRRILFGLGVATVLLVILWVVIMRLAGKTLQAERAAFHADRLRSLGTMSAGIAHEIRNPLGIVTLQIEEMEARVSQIQDDGLRSDLEEMTSDIKEEALRLKKLTEQFLSFSRAGSEKSLEAPIVVEPLVREIANLWYKGLDQEKRELKIQSRIGGRKAFFPKDKLRRILLNLLRNADEALGNQPGTVTIIMESSAESIRIIVRDNGPGMDQTTLEQIFDPFFTTRADGTGLGLALSRAMAEAHGAGLEAKSRPGEGASFTLTLPAADAFSAETRKP